MVNSIDHSRPKTPEQTVNILKPQSLVCAAVAVLSMACGKPGETTFSPTEEENVGATGGDGGSSAGGSGGASNGGMEMGGGGMGMTADAMDAGMADASAADAGGAVSDSGVAVSDAATEPSVCDLYCASVDRFVASDGGDGCTPDAAATCNGACLGGIFGGDPAKIGAAEAYFSCLADVETYQCNGTTVEPIAGTCSSEFMAWLG